MIRADGGTMKSIFAPWRMQYIRGLKAESCVFCRKSVRDNDFIVHEGKKAFVVMNSFPYICGHLLIVPCRHIGEIEELDTSEKMEIFAFIDLSVRCLKAAMHPHGFNIGLNLGKAAGAGIDDHLHAHVIPRWSGDTNFMTTVGETRVIPEDLQATRNHLLPFFEKFQREVGR